MQGHHAHRDTDHGQGREISSRKPRKQPTRVAEALLADLMEVARPVAAAFSYLELLVKETMELSC